MKQQKMSIKLKIMLLALLALVPASLRAQYYSFGTEPSGVKWRQIKSEHFRIIYPEETDSLARSYLMWLERQRPLVNEQVDIDTKPIPVILHAYTTLSNGSVSWAPKHMNLILSPNPYDCTQYPWQEQLVTHELRHVAQTQHFTKGLWRALYWPLGEQSTGLGMGLFANTKYLEGDATVAETEYTLSGRGRSAEFLMPLRTDFLNGIFRNWEQSTMGSYHVKNYDPYAVGYLMVTAERMRTGDADFIGKFYQNKAAVSDVTDIFKPKSKRYALSRTEALQQAQSYYFMHWYLQDLQRGKPTEGWRISAPQKLPCDYWGAIQITDTLSPMYGSMVVLRRGHHFAEEMMQIDTLGQERHVRYHASFSSKLSEAPLGRIYWSESVLHDPSSLENFSEIKFFDTRRDELGTLTHSTKYFNPSVSDDGRAIAVAEYPVGGDSRLVLLDAMDGEAFDSVAAPEGGQIFETMFVGEWLYITLATPEGLSLRRIRYQELQREDWQTVIPAQRASISGLRHLKGQWICFTSDHGGVLDIYALHPSNNQVFRLTNARFGATSPFLDESHKVLYFSEYDSQGFHLCSMDFSELLWEKVDFSMRPEDPVLEKVIAQGKAQSQVTVQENRDYLDPDKYPSKHYSKLLNGFHIHSWMPFYFNVDRVKSLSPDTWYEAVLPGATLHSQNALGDVVAMLAYSWWGQSSAHAKVTATVADFDVELYGDLNATTNGSLSTPAYKDDAGLLIDYPFNLFGGGWYSMLIPSLGLEFEKERVAGAQWQTSLQAGVRYYRMLSVPKAAIFPRWGFSVSGSLLQSFMGDNDFAAAGISSYLYTPGFTRGQGLKLSMATQFRLTDPASTYYNEHLLPLPRGYRGVATGYRHISTSADYAIPIWLGDAAIEGLLYLRRLQLIPFADCGMSWEKNGDFAACCSFGSSALLDFSVFRFNVGISAGTRFSYMPMLPSGSKTRWELVVSAGL